MYGEMIRPSVLRPLQAKGVALVMLQPVLLLTLKLWRTYVVSDRPRVIVNWPCKSKDVVEVDSGVLVIRKFMDWWGKRVIMLWSLPNYTLICILYIALHFFLSISICCMSCKQETGVRPWKAPYESSCLLYPLNWSNTEGMLCPWPLLRTWWWPSRLGTTVANTL
jgi:hypothetical protein